MSSDAPFQALLVEGTSGIGKSTLIDALLRRHVTAAEPRRIRTVVHLAQSHTYGPLAGPEDAGTLTVAENQRHLERVVGMMEWLHAGVQEHTRPMCLVALDTLHLTHCVRPGVVRWADVAGFDRRLAALGCRLLFLQPAPAAIWERGILPRADTPFIQKYAQKFGRTAQEVHDYFVREQERLAALFEASAMPKLRVRDDERPEDLVGRAYRFWKSSPADE